MSALTSPPPTTTPAHTLKNDTDGVSGWIDAFEPCPFNNNGGSAGQIGTRMAGRLSSAEVDAILESAAGDALIH